VHSISITYNHLSQQYSANLHMFWCVMKL